jgi:hypothetical protein
MIKLRWESKIDISTKVVRITKLYCYQIHVNKKTLACVAQMRGLTTSLANLHKTRFILYFPNQNICNHLKAFKGQDNPQMITTTQILGW